jgi:hypothetical protein
MYAEKYQWIKGDKTGKIETYSSHDNEWVYFMGGSRINAHILPEYMLQVDANTPLELSLDHAPVNIQRPVAPVAPPKPQPSEDFNPVRSLLKQAAKCKLECIYSFDIDIPKPSVYSLVSESFETDTDNLVLELVMSNIKQDELYNSVKEQIKEQILKFYTNGHTTRNTIDTSVRNEETTSTLDEQPSAQSLS